MLPRWSHDTKFTAFILRGIIIDGYNSTFTVLIWSSGSRRAGWIFFRRWEVWGLWEFDEIGLSGPFLSGEVAASDDLFESGGLNEGWVKVAKVIRGQRVIGGQEIWIYLPGEIRVSSTSSTVAPSALSKESRLLFSGGSSETSDDSPPPNPFNLPFWNA